MPYGYDPTQWVPKDKYGIGAASQIVASTVAGMPEKIRAQEVRENAIQAATDNWRDMETAYTSVRKMYRDAPAVQQLVANGQMTQEELAANVAKIEMPTSVDRKDPGAYIDKVGAILNELGKDAEGRQRSGQVSQIGQQAQRQNVEGAPEQVSGGQLGGGFTEQTITERGAPADTERFKERFGQIAAIEGVSPTKEETQQQADVSGTQPAKDVAAQERQVAQDVASQTQQEFDNNLATRREERLKIESEIRKSKKKGMSQLTMNEKSSILQFNVRQVNEERKSVGDAIRLNKGLEEPNQDIIDQLTVKKAALDKEHKDAMKTLLDLVKITVSKEEVAPSGGESQDVTKARQAIAVAKDLIEKGDFTQYSKEQLTLVIQNAQNVIGQ